jgi:hypothetical protein
MLSGGRRVLALMAFLAGLFALSPRRTAMRFNPGIWSFA